MSANKLEAFMDTAQAKDLTLLTVTVTVMPPAGDGFGSSVMIQLANTEAGIAALRKIFDAVQPIMDTAAGDAVAWRES